MLTGDKPNSNTLNGVVMSNEPRPINEATATELIRQIDSEGMDYNVIELNGQYYDVTNADPQKVVSLIKSKSNPTHTTKEES